LVADFLKKIFSVLVCVKEDTMLSRVLVLAAVAAIALAGAPTFAACGSGGTLVNPSFTTTDADWKAGTTVHFTVSGDLASPIESGSKITTVAKFAGTVVEDGTDDLCTYEGTPFTCPTAAGVQSWTFPLAIPAIPFAGKLSSSSNFNNADGSLIFCMNVDVQL
jgi:hypothetical protein